MQRTLLHQNCGNRTLALVELRLNHQTSRVAVRICLQFLHICREKNHIEKVIDTFVGLCGNRADNRAAAPVLRDQLILHELLFDAVDVGIRLINLVDGDDDFDICRLRVVNCLNGLRHHAIVRCDHKNRDIRRFGTAHTHCRERFVARRVEEGNQSVVCLDLISADVLCNAAGLTACDRGLADGIEKRSFTVVDMTHDNNDRRTGNHVLGILVFLTEQLLNDINLLFSCAENIVFKCDFLGLLIRDFRVHRIHFTLRKELFDEIGSRPFHHLRELADGQRIRKNQFLDFLLYLLDLRLLRHNERMTRRPSVSAAGLKAVFCLMALVILIFEVILIRSAGNCLLHQSAVTGCRSAL